MRKSIHKFYHIQGNKHYAGGYSPRGYILNAVLIPTALITLFLIAR